MEGIQPAIQQHIEEQMESTKQMLDKLDSMDDSIRGLPESLDKMADSLNSLPGKISEGIAAALFALTNNNA